MLACQPLTFWKWHFLHKLVAFPLNRSCRFQIWCLFSHSMLPNDLKNKKNILPFLCLFRWKTFCKDSFPHLLVFGSLKKIGQRKTLTKIRLVFYKLFSIKNFRKQSLSLAWCITLIYYLLLATGKQKLLSYLVGNRATWL